MSKMTVICQIMNLATITTIILAWFLYVASPFENPKGIGQVLISGFLNTTPIITYLSSATISIKIYFKGNTYV